MRMRHIFICGLSHPTTFFPNYLINGKTFEKIKFTEHKMWVLIFPTTFVWNISFNEEFRETWSKMYIGLHVWCPLFLSDFNETWILLTYFRKSTTNQISRKSVKCEPSCMWTEGQTHDETNAILRKRLKSFNVTSTKTSHCHTTLSGNSTFSRPRRSYGAIKQCTKHTSRM